MTLDRNNLLPNVGARVSLHSETTSVVGYVKTGRHTARRTKPFTVGSAYGTVQGWMLPTSQPIPSMWCWPWITVSSISVAARPIRVKWRFWSEQWPFNPVQVTGRR